MFQNGAVGHAGPNWSYGDGLVFQNNLDPLWTGGLILGTSERGMVNGQVGSFGIDSDFRNTSPISGFSSVEGKWDQVALCTFDDLSAPSPMDIEVAQRSYSNTGEDVLILRYNLECGSEPLEGLYAGMFADWDVGVDLHDQNLGGFDLSRNLAYQFLDGGAPDPSYYGIVALEGLSGTRITGYGRQEYIRDSSFQWISNINDSEITEKGEYRMWIGSGPFILAEGGSLQVCFALVAGSDLEELQANADLAASKYLELEDITHTEPVIPAGFSLGQNHPNPFTDRSEIHYAIPFACDVLVDVYSAEGVKVKTIQHKGQVAGHHAIQLSGEGLDPGIYFYSLRAGEFSGTRMMVVY